MIETEKVRLPCSMLLPLRDQKKNNNKNKNQNRIDKVEDRKMIERREE